MDRILLAVCGLTPQIITETLYALHREGHIPDRVIILTTRAGRTACLRTLTGPHGMIARFLSDYGYPPSPSLLRESDILTPDSPADDIATIGDSSAFQRLCMAEACRLTRDADTCVDFSLAGGRKTMGASLALAAQCYGRDTDRLFHVLVAPAFESRPDFYYPPPVPTLLPARASLPPVHTGDAGVTLAMLPFPRLRPHLPPELLEQPHRLEPLLAAGPLPAPARLALHVRERALTILGKRCVLPPTEFALLLSFALRKKQFPCTGTCETCPGDCFMDSDALLADSAGLAAVYERLRISAAARSSTGIRNISPENFMAYKSKLHRHLREALGMASSHAEIASMGRRPHVRYGLRIPKMAIFIEK